MRRLYNWLFLNIKKDSKGRYHDTKCALFSHNFTVIKNTGGTKLWEGQIKYCPICGAKLKD